ncbi:methyltransferase domain-containing protein [Phormidium yuhuli AB48]|uniref:Methyltransferase domain-containing protein n=1 Tax=Phormidium yuhuli AB48 TaxID=2940671 RepID=A0ABY5AMB7_9CYAN|nr:methyltransferase domain-containing protein [Phormidium yuhuli]USR90357.1 methyltransferase domain-containing protein [Phormidium yuhuli AB48]
MTTPPQLDTPLYQAIARSLKGSLSAQGQIAFPAVKGAVDPYGQRINRLFSLLGKPLSPSELVKLCQHLATLLKDPPTSSQIVLSYEPARAPRQGLVYRLDRVKTKSPSPALISEGQLVLPSIPCLRRDYLQQLAGIFALLTHPLNQAQAEQLEARLQEDLETGFLLSPQARLVVRYASNPPEEGGLSCQVSVVTRSLAEQSQTLLQQSPDYCETLGPLTKVMDLAKSFSAAETPVLVAGVGTAQSALPLARQGFSVDAMDLAPPFAHRLGQLLQQEPLPIRVMAEDILDPLVTPKPGHYGLGLLTEVASRVADGEALEGLLSKIAQALRPGGTLLLNLFLASEELPENPLLEQTARVFNSTLFRRSQLESLLQRLPFTLVDEVPVLAYEREHRPADQAKLDPWYARWAQGQQVFAMAEPPMALHWLTLVREDTSDDSDESDGPKPLFSTVEAEF